MASGRRQEAVVGAGTGPRTETEPQTGFGPAAAAGQDVWVVLKPVEAFFQESSSELADGLPESVGLDWSIDFIDLADDERGDVCFLGPPPGVKTLEAQRVATSISRRRVPCVGYDTDFFPFFFYFGRIAVGDRFHYASGLSETQTSGSDGHLSAGLCWQDREDWGCWEVAEASSGRRFMTGLFRTKPVEATALVTNRAVDSGVSWEQRQ
ncbi:hypothetical protein QBC45DRAFT_467926 [Copromyces sp. CBS 386.78]|nr:hypothetical protein QBC45DRAFT_467926 [Copromyces sp. CBS 386.78]